MGEILGLNNICCGESACVTVIETEGSIRRRFMDIGLTEGAVVKCVGVSPMGDPKAFLIRGAVIALRCDDCKGVKVIRVEKW